MSNVATERRDTNLARDIESDRIRTWADGFGIWHASVSMDYANPARVARYAIRLELQARAARGAYVDPPRVRLANDGPGHVCTLDPPCQPTRLHYVETTG